MRGRKQIVKIGSIVDTFDDGTVLVSPIERAERVDSPRTLVAKLRGGSAERPERTLKRIVADWPRVIVHGHSRHAGATYVTLQCPLRLIDALLAISFVERIDERQLSIDSRAGGAGDAKARKTSAKPSKRVSADAPPDALRGLTERVDYSPIVAPLAFNPSAVAFSRAVDALLRDDGRARNPQ